MNNKKKIILITLIEVILLSVSLYTKNLPFFNQRIVIIRQLSRFAFYAILLIVSVLVIRSLIINELERINKSVKPAYKKWGTAIVIIIGLYVISTVQINDIKKYELGEVACSYYDDYGNKLYESTFPYNCPEAIVNDQTETTLSLSFSETLNRVNHSLYIDRTSIGSKWDNDRLLNNEVEAKVDVEYKNQKIVHYEIEWLFKVESYSETEKSLFGYKYVKKVITNTYKPNEFISVRENYYRDSLISTRDDLDQIMYQEVSEDDLFKKEIVTTSYKEGTNYIRTVSINKETIDSEGISISEIYAIGEIENRADGSIHVELNHEDDEDDFDAQMNYRETSSETYFRTTRYQLESDDAVVNQYKEYKGLSVISETKNGVLRDNKTHPYYWYTELFSSDLRIEDRVFNDVRAINDRDFGFKTIWYDTSIDPNQNVFHVFTLHEGDHTHRFKLKYLDYEEMLFDNYEHNELIFEHNPIVYN